MHYHRIYPDGVAQPQQIERRQWHASTQAHTYDALQAIYDEDDSLTLYYNHQEFSELEYGASLYQQVARCVLSMRRSAERYPCYITDIDLSQRVSHDRVQTLHFLQRKTALEQRLNQALLAL